jgi:hypothetical protein
MMTILFKNSKETKVSENIGNIIRDNILAGNAHDFQLFTESADKNLIFAVRLSEVVCITKSD